MMLAIELSTRRGSVCLHDGERVVAHEAWDDPAARHPGLYNVLPRIMRDAGAEWLKLSAIAAGRGPGSFSGIRVALTAAQALALPSKLPVIAVSSGEALAQAVAREPDAPSRIVVAGDARRGTVWYARFHRHGREARIEGAWALAPADNFAACVPADALLVASDSARLQRATGLTAVSERLPDAADVAALAWHRLRQGIAGDPPVPLYLHPPV